MDNYICAFIDVLGAKDKALDFEFAKNLDCVISKFHKKLNEIGFVLRPISDGFVLAVKTTGDSTDDICYLLETISWLSQHFLIDAGVLVRGGVALGNLYVGENLIFGEALVKAYTIESKEAIYPRVVVHNDIVDNLNINKENYVWAEGVLEILIQDNDNRWYVEQMYPIYDCLESEAPEVFEHFLEISNALRENASSNAYYYQKFAWWANVVNSKLEKQGKFFRLIV